MRHNRRNLALEIQVIEAIVEGSRNGLQIEIDRFQRAAIVEEPARYRETIRQSVGFS